MTSKDMSEKKKAVIIGGGPAGLTAAYALCNDGIPSVVFEKDDIVGGISRTAHYKGFYFDIGGHRFFTKVKSVDEMWHKILSDDFLTRERLSRIYYNGKFFHYPLRVLNALTGIGPWVSFLVGVSYIRAQIFPIKPEETLEAWVSNRFGRRLYSIFFKNYTEKVWGIPCTEISAEWSAQRIKGLSLVSALRDALLKQKRTDTGDVIATLIEEFKYPRKGPGMMWEAVAGIVNDNGGQVHLNANVDKIYWDHKRIKSVEVYRNGSSEVVEGTDFISSMPVRELIQKMDPPAPEKVLKAAGKLNYRDFITVVLIVNKNDVFPDNWIYVHDPEVKVGRLQNFKNWSPYMVPDENKTCIGLEYFCFEGDELWNMKDEDLVQLGKIELAKMGFIQESDVEDGTVVRMPKTYPVYDSEYQSAIDVIRDFIDPFANFQLVGRNGMHKYNNMDHSMLTAMLAAENIQGKNHDLWKVNAEQEYHEEVYAKEEREIEKADQLIIKTFGRIDKLALATALGSVFGLFIFLATIFLDFSGVEVIGVSLQLLNQYFIGYSVSLKGAFIGFFYSFIWGFFSGWFIAYTRNILVAFFIYQVKRKLELLTFKDFLDHF